MIWYTHFPIIMLTIPQTQFEIPGQLEKVTMNPKIIVTLLFNDGFDKKKTSYWSCLYPLLRYYSLFPKKFQKYGPVLFDSPYILLAVIKVFTLNVTQYSSSSVISADLICLSIYALRTDKLYFFLWSKSRWMYFWSTVNSTGMIPCSFRIACDVL